MNSPAPAVTSNVFLLDDDEGILRLQRRALERAGHHVTSASTLEQANTFFMTGRVLPDLLVLDYNVAAAATGLDFYRSLRARGVDVPAILVTGFSDEGRAIEALRAGVRDVIPKVGDYLDYLPEAAGRVVAQVNAARALVEAETASRAKDRFLAILSHELRTPLTPVLTALHLIDNMELSEDVRELTGLIRRNVELETRLIDDLLDLTQISRGKLRLQSASTDIHEKLRSAMQTVEFDARRKQLNVTLETRATRTTVFADPARLQQVFWNVLKNAVKFTPAGGSIAIRTSDGSTQECGDTVRVEVTDTGIGFSAEAIDRIFNAFEQGGNEVTKRFGGLGLGLNICRTLVEVHGGKISAASGGVGNGATFTIDWPVKSPGPTDASAPVPEASTERPSVARVLLVEDHRDTAVLMTRLLKRYGYQVSTADSVASALSAADTQPFDLVVSDIGLPDGSGLDLMPQLKARYRLKGIALSGFGMEEDVARSHQAGFAAHLVKPVDSAQLEQALQRVVSAAS